MSNSLCSTGFAYDSDDASRRAFAIRMGRIELGTELQKRGRLLDCTFHRSTRSHPEHAGEIAALVLGLTDDQLAERRVWDIDRFADQYEASLRALVGVAA